MVGVKRVVAFSFRSVNSVLQRIQQIQWPARNCGPFFCVTNDSRRMFYTVFLAKKSRSSHVNLAVGLDKSDGTADWHDYIAADINKDGRVGADDALNILKFAVGLTDGPSADWVFVDGDADYSEINCKNTDYDGDILINDVMTDLSINMTGILVGDVDGSYIA